VGLGQQKSDECLYIKFAVHAVLFVSCVLLLVLSCLVCIVASFKLSRVYCCWLGHVHCFSCLVCIVASFKFSCVYCCWLDMCIFVVLLCVLLLVGHVYFCSCLVCNCCWFARVYCSSYLMCIVLICLVCIVVVVCIVVMCICCTVCVYCCFYFRCRTAG
jgi:hypothetical protein